MGDGKKTIRQLLLEFNQTYFRGKLESQEYNRILKEKEVFQYNWKFNLSQGAIAKKIEDNVLVGKLTEIAQKVSNEINLNFGSIDIIETVDHKLLVLEANSGVMLENYIRLNPKDYERVKEIYREAIVSLFVN